MRIFLHSLLLLLCFGFVFAWEASFLSDYSIQLLGFLVFTYIVITLIRQKSTFSIPESIDIFLIITAIMLFIFETNALYSPLFFLVYFLGFGVAITFEPVIVFIFVICVISIFLPQVLKNGSWESYIRLASVCLIGPLAFFFGKSFSDKVYQEKKMNDLEKNIDKKVKNMEDDIEDVLINEEDLTVNTEKKLDKVLEKAEDLRNSVKQ